jgi:hypothetical protein
MLGFDEEAFHELAAEVGFCLDNLRHPDCALKYAGRFYEQAAEHLRAHAILRLLFDARPDKFSNDLVMSGQSRRAFLRRCRATEYSDYFTARSRTGSLFDSIAGNDFELAAEIARLSPDRFQNGDEYEDDFFYQKYVGLWTTNADQSERGAALDALEAIADDCGKARADVGRSLEAGDPAKFESSFQNLLRMRTEELATDGAVKEDVTAAIGANIFIEGVALLKLARHIGVATRDEYPMCPALAVEIRTPIRPPDEFAQP